MNKKKLWICLVMLAVLLTACGRPATPSGQPGTTTTAAVTTTTAPPDSGYIASVEDVPPFRGAAYVVVGDNCPEFTEQEKTAVSFEEYASLDSLGRCGVTFACVGRDLMPTEDRGSIGQVKPTGWHTVKYDFVDGKYLYNRCHLIGFQLTGENANRSNLITGTRYLNIEGMLPFENLVADYVKETGNHVLYRVTPIFRGDDLLASGVEMEGWSVEDDGEGVCFHVYAYNAQPGVAINYATGESALDTGTTAVTTTVTAVATVTTTAPRVTYVLNVSSKKFHLPTCGQVEEIKESNRKTTDLSREKLLEAGYSPCKTCDP